MKYKAYNEVIDYLKSAGQGRLALHFSLLDYDKKRKLLSDIEPIDFLSLKEAWNTSDTSAEELSLIEAIDYTEIEELNELHFNKGMEILKNNKAALVIMAGGMGSRLGFEGPKGAYILSSGKSLFEIHIDNLISNAKDAAIMPRVLIMCSDLNEDYTKKFFEDNNYFSYHKDRITFFRQGNLPAVDEEGEVLLASDTRVTQLPDGNGGVFKALKTQGIMKLLVEEGIEFLQVTGVDNVLLKALDPVFLGFLSLSCSDIASKSIARKNETEKVGVILKKDGHPAILEYTEIPEELLKMRDERGNFIYNDANFASHLFKLDKLNQLMENSLPYHRAFKKIPYFDGRELIQPDSPNAYKLEHFIFDLFAYYDDMAVLRVKREEEFSPLKNKTGEDSVETAKRDYERVRG